MVSLGALQKKIADRINELQFESEPRELYEPISYIMGLGGKRLRPALCLLACDLVQGNIEEALEPAIGIELFHNFTLLHDDIMDKAPIRRGKPTVHIKWNDNAAILSGDTMMALSYDYIMKAPEPVRSAVFMVFNKTAIEVCEGQQYDMNFETRQQVSIDDYLEMIRLKTAVLLAGSLKIGALIGGADAAVANALYEFGQHIGIAFQLKDDLLDVYSDQQKFGKATGGDILSNKKTFLYLKAFELAQGDVLAALTHLFNDASIAAEKKVEGVTKIYDELHIRDLAEERITSYYDQALKYLPELETTGYDTNELMVFADLLKKRDF